jgi:hypothetical protein
LSQQLSLLDEPVEASKTAEAIDEIRDRFGTTAIGPASSISQHGLRVVRKGAQQWGPDQQPKHERNEQENRRSR